MLDHASQIKQNIVQMVFQKYSRKECAARRLARKATLKALIELQSKEPRMAEDIKKYAAALLSKCGKVFKLSGLKVIPLCQIG